MSPIKKPASSSQDYGRRPEMKGGKDAPGFKGYLHGGGKSGTYRELIGRSAESTILQRTIAAWKKHSEFKKPYLSDEFPEMEHYYSKPVNFPGSEYSPYDTGGIPSECWDVCKKNHSGVYFDDECYVYIWADTRLTLVGDQVIIDNAYTMEMERIDDALIAGTTRAIYRSVEAVDANTNVIWTVYQPLFEACPGVDEIHAKSCRKTYNEPETCADCPALIPVEWNDAYSAETVARSATVAIGVLYGVAPYTWAVSGTGFTLGSASTSGVANTLIADGTACGAAEITVTDTCGDTATGYVRCTTGVWNLDEDYELGETACGMSPPFDSITGPYLGGCTTNNSYRMVKTVGQYQVDERVTFPNCSSGCTGDCCGGTWRWTGMGDGTPCIDDAIRFAANCLVSSITDLGRTACPACGAWVDTDAKCWCFIPSAAVWIRQEGI